MKSKFWWGTAIENTWLAQDTRGERPLDEFEVTQHYRFLDEDIALAADLGIDMVRYSAPWYRVNPAPGKFDWSWFDRALERWEKRGIEVFYDFVHYGTPLWLENAYVNADYPQRVAEYAAAFAERYKGRIALYTPFNEPFYAIYRAGRAGTWPPYLRGDDGFVKVLEGICRGIVRTVETLRSVDPKAQIITANPLSAGREDRKNSAAGQPTLTDYLFAVEDLVSGRVSGGHPLEGYLRNSGMSESTLEWFREHRFDPDIFGVNFYPVKWYERPLADPDYRYIGPNYYPVTHPIQELSSEDRLANAIRDFENCLRDTAAHVKRPLFITETSGGYTPEEKIGWLTASTDVVKKLRSEGIQIVGYLWWPLFDAVRWDYREGRRPAETYIWPGRWNNGLYGLKPDFDGTLQRVPTAAVDSFRAVVANARK